MLPVTFFDFGKFVVIEVVLRVHLNNLSLSRRSHNLDDLNKMVNAAFSDKERHSIEHLKYHAA